MKVALIQITVGSNFDENFEKSKKFLNDSLALNPDFILLPECFLFLSNKLLKYLRMYRFMKHLSWVTSFCLHAFGKLPKGIFLTQGQFQAKERQEGLSRQEFHIWERRRREPLAPRARPTSTRPG